MTERDPLSTPAVAGGLPFDASQIQFTQATIYAAGTLGAHAQSIVSVKDAPFNAIGDGVTDDTAAIVAADIAAAAAKASLFFQGTFLCSSQLVPTCKWIFDGRSTDNQTPASYLIKKSTMTVPLVLISTNGFIGVNLAIVGQGGNTGDGIQITGNGVALYDPLVKDAGQDGIRVGLDAGGNANSFRLIHPRCFSNGRRGIYIHDNAGGSPNANAGIITSPFLQSNAGDGIRINNGKSNTITGIVSESNTGWGIYLDAVSALNNFYGGDVEANTAGAIFTEVESGGNGFNILEIGTVSGTITNNGVTNAIKTALNQLAIYGTWTPTVAGAAVTVNSALYSRQGKQVLVTFDLTWPATADATAVTVAGMLTTPGTPAANSGSFVAGYTDYANPIHGVAGAAGIAFYNAGGVPSTAITNVNLSTRRVIGSCVYRIA